MRLGRIISVFLVALRHATVIDCLPTTHFDIILKIVRNSGIDEDAFIRHYQDGSAEAALNEDLDFVHRLGLHSLPSYLIQYIDKALLMQSFAYQDFADAITKKLSYARPVWATDDVVSCVKPQGSFMKHD